jgi:hypothetical protein
LARDNSAAYLPYVALMLNNLAILFRATHRLAKAECADQEALQIRRRLAKANPAVFAQKLIANLGALANLCEQQGRNQEASQLRTEASEFQESLREASGTTGH